MTWGALALAALLAGCGTPVDVEDGDPVAIAEGANGSGASPQVVAVESLPMNARAEPDDTPDTMPPDGPVLTPDQVWDKLLALVESLDSEADLDLAQMERVIGLPLLMERGSRKTRMVAGNTTAGWDYIFALSRYSKDDVRAAFDSYLPDLDTASKVSPTCSFSFRRLRDELVARGFKPHDTTASADRIFSWSFNRHPLSLDTSYYFLQPQQFDAPDYEQACVSRITMSFSIPMEELRGR